MHTAQYWIDHLHLKSHPEGGFYKETYRAKEVVDHSGLPPRFSGARNISTAIYFLLRSQDKSMFHRIKSDELWHFHDGGTLHIYVIADGQLRVEKLGCNPDQGESLQVVIPANSWFGAKHQVSDTFTLSSCTVAPGFDFHDFELADRKTLTKAFPDHRHIIADLTP